MLGTSAEEDGHFGEEFFFSMLSFYASLFFIIF